jgi:hypothetical protein
MRDGVHADGPKVITFAGIRKFNMLPLADVAKELLELGAKGMGRDVEIEFAATLAADGTPEFYVLQIRPLVALRERQQVVVGQVDLDGALVATEIAMGNGILEGMSDVVLVPPETFDPTKTVEIATEVGEINRRLHGTSYVLVGPGRWGTQDRFAGIPVRWDQISWARTVVEISLENFRVAPSHGTHFFHNMTSLGVLYLAVPYGTDRAVFRWADLDRIPPTTKMRYVRHIKLPYPLAVKVDGSSGRGVILRHSE